MRAFGRPRIRGVGVMKDKNILLLGAAALAAYFLFFKKQPSASEPNQQIPIDWSSFLGAPGANLGAAFGKGLTEAAAPALTGALTSSPAVQIGGGLNTAWQQLTGGYPSGLSVGSQAILGNVDYINQIMGANIIKAGVSPTTLSTITNLRAGAGVSVPVAQAYMDVAARAVPASIPLYGVSLRTGGQNVFNFPAGGTATTARTYTAAAPTATSGGGLVMGQQYSSPASGAGVAQISMAATRSYAAPAPTSAPAPAAPSSSSSTIASRMARGLM